MKKSDKGLFKQNLNITDYNRLSHPYNKLADRIQQTDIQLYGKVLDDTWNGVIKRIREIDALTKQGVKVSDPKINEFLKIYKLNK